MPWYSNINLEEHPAFGPWYQRTRRQPSWVTKFALLAAVLVIVVPLVLLTIAAIIVGMIVFFVLSLIASVANLFTGTLAPRSDDGRRNVRIVQR